MSEEAQPEPVVISPQEGPQTDFLTCMADVVFYGGAAGGGKTFALLLEPLYDLYTEGFEAVLFRRTTPQITNPGALWDEAQKLYIPLGARPVSSPVHRLTFPTGMRVTFSHLEHERNKHDWQGSQIPLIGFDELTHFTWGQFNYMLSRNRSVTGTRGRIRGTCNPDPDSWVRQFIDWWVGDDGYIIPERSGYVRYFVIKNDEVLWADTWGEAVRQYGNPDLDAHDPEQVKPKSFTFVAASLADNPALLDKDPDYRGNLEALDEVEKGRLLFGNWNIRPSSGTYFKRSDFQILDTCPVLTHSVRAWDQAGTAKTNSNKPDWTAGVRMGRDERGYIVVTHVERDQLDPADVDALLYNTATRDGPDVRIRLAQDPGQAGKSQAASQIRMLDGFDVVAHPISGSKASRAKPFSAQVRAGNVRLVRGPWNEAFLNELEKFKGSDKDVDDQVDAAADAHDELVAMEDAEFDVW